MFVKLLTQEMIDAGKELTESLDKSFSSVDASLWFYDSELNAWRFIIALPEVRSHGPLYSYRKVQSLISRMPRVKDIITLKDLSILKSDDPLIYFLRKGIGTGKKISNVRFSGNTIDGILFEDVYIYKIK